MGQQHITYNRLHTSSEDDTEKDQRSICRKWKLMWKRRCIFTIIFTIITITLLLSSSICAFYFWHMHSKLSIQWTECREQLQNQTIEVQVKAFKICTETLKKGCDKAKEDSNDLQVQLEAASQNLNKTHQRWDSCQKDLNALHDRIQTKQQEAENKLQGCQAQLQYQTAQVQQAQAALKKSMEALKKDLDKAKKDGGDLQAQLVTTHQPWNSCQKELPDGQSGEFQAQLQNQTTQVQAQLETCTEALKKDRDKAKKESDDLRAQLAMATQSLSNNSQRWDSCRKELHNLQDNITFQSQEISKERAEKHKLQGEIKRLQQQMFEWENQKKQEQPTSSGSIICDLGITLLPFLALLLL